MTEKNRAMTASTTQMVLKTTKKIIFGVYQ